MRLTPSNDAFIDPRSRAHGALGLLVLLGLVACQARTPTAQVVIPPSSAAPEAPETSQEAKPSRARDGDTGARQAQIIGTALAFTPPARWPLRHLSGHTIVQASKTGAALALAGVEFLPGDAKEEEAAKDTMLAELARQLELGAIPRKMSWKKPDDVRPAAGMRIRFWSIEEVVSRGTSKGPLLVLWTPTGEGKGLVGLAFVPEDDRSQADVAIMKAIESIEKAR